MRRVRHALRGDDPMAHPIDAWGPAPASGAAFPVWRTLRFVVGIILAQLAIIVVAISALLIAKTPPAQLNNAGGIALQIPIMLSYLGTVPLGLLAWRRLSGRSLSALGLRRLVRADLVVIAIAFALHYAVFAGFTLVLQRLGLDNHTQAGFEHFAPHGWFDQTCAVVGIGLVGPFAEELFFRGLIANALRRWAGPIAGLIVSSALFSAAHGDAVLFPMLFVDGLIYCAVYWRTGNLYASFGVHGITNTISTLLAFTGH